MASAAKQTLSNLVGYGSNEAMSLINLNFVDRTHNPNTSSAGTTHTSSSTAATHDTTPSRATNTTSAPTVHDLTTAEGIGGSHSHAGHADATRHHHEGTQHPVGSQQGGSTQIHEGVRHQEGTHHHGGIQSHGDTRHHEGTQHPVGIQQVGGTQFHEGTHHQEGTPRHEGTQHPVGNQQGGSTQPHEGTQHHGETQHHEGHHLPHIPHLHKSSSHKDSDSSAVPDRDVQTPNQGPDPALVGEPATGSSKLTGSAEPGSHSAVFGLTPDGKKYDKTSSKSTPLKPASSKQPALADKTESNDTSSRAPTGQGVHEQLHKPETGAKGLERTDPTPTSAGSEGKPGSGLDPVSRGSGSVPAK
ncbi:hypothetical protein A1O3_09931 [Capronia epimyces CBS 606.96]|uniref:Uncharacterized protein n=1 Tax=Capronia epimyces CBS 606.96 TaxID=1182542 RepID=W9XB28_9EURO|nr:uncharacterized protein A1O3_09931 [Capronia epimyces CBS 606.96]EXJ77702.1 hypothetical protein A1O3_09931 [Capronia epimyces CBS 606.96]